MSEKERKEKTNLIEIIIITLPFLFAIEDADFLMILLQIAIVMLTTETRTSFSPKSLLLIQILLPKSNLSSNSA